MKNSTIHITPKALQFHLSMNQNFNLSLIFTGLKITKVLSIFRTPNVTVFGTPNDSKVM